MTYKQKYKEHLQFKCDFCGAIRGNPCLALNEARGIAVECLPHANRWNNMREKHYKLERQNDKENLKQVDAVQKWLINRG